ncbi:MAG: molybdenum cofactor guanylyltransferase [Actinobacteria bacterium]|nr:molybdenum cofactor guanylyltransferase [Actinomycetota bacterium]
MARRHGLFGVVVARALTGVLLVGGASRRFGTPKALVRVGDETLAERGHRVLLEACDEVLVIGKTDELDLPFEVIDDGVEARVPMAGVMRALRLATHEIVVCLPVDCPLISSVPLRALGEACRDAAVHSRGPLPGAWAKSALPVLERCFAVGDYGLKHAYSELDVARPALDERLLADADTPDELLALVTRGVVLG